MANVLYISYDGMLENLGESQVLQYLFSLSTSNEIFLISFEKVADLENLEKMNAQRKRVESYGIRWFPLRYHKRLSVLATAYDIICGIRKGLGIASQYKLDIVHARSYVAGVMAMTLKRKAGLRFIFDMRGFWVDERVDGGIWRRNGGLYHVGKWMEQKLLRNCDGLVSLTRRAVDWLRENQHISPAISVRVIPTCVNLDNFQLSDRVISSSGLKAGYFGTVGTWYLFDEFCLTANYFLDVDTSNTLLIVNRGEHELIQEKLTGHGIDFSRCKIESRPYEDMPNVISEVDFSIFYIKPVFSKMASMPTKLGELLACGRPVITNRGIGDVDDVIERYRVGVLLDDFSEDTLRNSLEMMQELLTDNDLSHRCRQAAEQVFSLSNGTVAYQSLYNELNNER